MESLDLISQGFAFSYQDDGEEGRRRIPEGFKDTFCSHWNLTKSEQDILAGQNPQLNLTPTNESLL